MLGGIKRLLLRMLPATVAGRLRAWKVRRIIQSYQARVVEHVYGPGSLRVWLPDPLAAGWYDHDWPDLPEIAFLRKHQSLGGARIFDIGAHHRISSKTPVLGRRADF